MYTMSECTVYNKIGMFINFFVLNTYVFVYILLWYKIYFLVLVVVKHFWKKIL